MLPILLFYLVLLGSLVLFITGWIRYDLVAMVGLLALVLGGVIPGEEAFAGFSNPAVITVVAVLIISRGLENAGITDLAGRFAALAGPSPTLQVGFFCLLVAVISAFINNVGALAMMMPVAIEVARRNGRSPAYLLMPMAFASLLGGMTTLIGTPPNLLVSNYRSERLGEPFGMFDFSPSGIPIAVIGIGFIALAGWRMIPRRVAGSAGDLFDIGNYFAEVVVPGGNRTIGQALREVLLPFDEVTLVGFRRKGERFSINDRHLQIMAEDVLVVRASSRSLKQFIDDNQFQLGGIKPGRDDLSYGEMELVEVVVMKGSTAEGSSARKLELRRLFGINMIAIAREGVAILQKLKDVRFRSGDVLLLQMPVDNMRNSLVRLGLLPLARRQLHVARARRLIGATAAFGTAIVATTIGFLPPAVAFTAAAVSMILLRIVSVREAHEAIDWSVVILLGAMIPVGNAFETSGAVGQLTGWIASVPAIQHPVVMLTIVLLLTMTLSDILNNAATAIVMAPFAAAVAGNLNVSADPFLMAVCIGASCAFLTPVGHQSNTLVLGPGGYHFGDFFRMGFLLELLIAATCIPILVWYWGLDPAVASP